MSTGLPDQSARFQQMNYWHGQRQELREDVVRVLTGAERRISHFHCMQREWATEAEREAYYRGCRAGAPPNPYLADTPQEAAYFCGMFDRESYLSESPNE